MCISHEQSRLKLALSIICACKAIKCLSCMSNIEENLKRELPPNLYKGIEYRAEASNR